MDNVSDTRREGEGVRKGRREEETIGERRGEEGRGEELTTVIT